MYCAWHLFAVANNGIEDITIEVGLQVRSLISQFGKLQFHRPTPSLEKKTRCATMISGLEHPMYVGYHHHHWIAIKFHSMAILNTD